MSTGPAFNISLLPNPLTPLAFFPPDIAHQFEICYFVYIGTTGALVWDILSNVFNDWRLVKNYRVGIATYVYFASRIATLFFVFWCALFYTYPLKDCVLAQRIAAIAIAVAVPLNSLMFTLRARAIYDRNPLFIAGLVVLWLGVAAGSIMLPFGIAGANIGITEYCITGSSKSFIAANAIAPLCNDTAIFIAISWRLYKNAYVKGVGNGIRTLVVGEKLPLFSRAVLQDGQLYYLITVTSNILTFIMFYNDRVGEAYRLMFTSPNVMLTNALAAHVFRNTKFGYQKRIITTSEMMSRSTAGDVIFMDPRGPTSNPHGKPSGPGSGLGPSKAGTVVHISNVTEHAFSPADNEYFMQAKKEDRV